MEVVGLSVGVGVGVGVDKEHTVTNSMECVDSNAPDDVDACLRKHVASKVATAVEVEKEVEKEGEKEVEKAAMDDEGVGEGVGRGVGVGVGEVKRLMTLSGEEEGGSHNKGGGEREKVGGAEEDDDEEEEGKDAVVCENEKLAFFAPTFSSSTPLSNSFLSSLPQSVEGKTIGSLSSSSIPSLSSSSINTAVEKYIQKGKLVS